MQNAQSNHEYGYGGEYYTPAEAIERFRMEKEKHPTAIVTLEEHCPGKWEVFVFGSDYEKQDFFRSVLEVWSRKFQSAFRPAK